MNQLPKMNAFLSCLVSMILSTTWVLADDWKLTFDQLSSHEMSFRVVVSSEGETTSYTKQRKVKDFEKTGLSTITAETVEELRCKVFKLQQLLQSAELKKKSARDVDIRYRVVYEHNGAEFEIRWLAGQIGGDKAASETYLAILELLQKSSGLDTKLRPDPFLKATRGEIPKTESR